MLRWEIINDPNKIFDYQNRWDQLFKSTNNEPSTSFEWTNALLSTHLEKKDYFALVVLKDTNNILGCVPLIIRKKKKFGVLFLNLFPLSEIYNTHSDILFNKASCECFEVFLEALFNLPQRWDVLRMNRIIENNPFIKCIECSLKNKSIKYQIRRSEPSFYITLTNNFNDYLKNRSSKFRNYLKRMEKKLNSIGNVEVVTLKDSSAISEAYNHILSIEKKSWKHKQRTAISSIKKQQEFYRFFCASAHENKWLHLHFLFLNNNPIAYDLGLIKCNTYWYLKTSFIEEFRQFSPATILRSKLIEKLINSGIKFFDFPGDPYEWERQWTEEVKWHKSLLIYNNTFQAQFISLYEKLKSRKTIKLYDRNQFNYHDPQAIKSDE